MTDKKTDIICNWNGMRLRLRQSVTFNKLNVYFFIYDIHSFIHLFIFLALCGLPCDFCHCVKANLPISSHRTWPQTKGTEKGQWPKNSSPLWWRFTIKTPCTFSPFGHTFVFAFYIVFFFFWLFSLHISWSFVWLKDNGRGQGTKAEWKLKCRPKPKLHVMTFLTGHVQDSQTTDDERQTGLLTRECHLSRGNGKAVEAYTGIGTFKFRFEMV